MTARGGGAGGGAAGAHAITGAVALLDDSVLEVRTGIAERLGALGAPAVAPLQTVVNKAASEARWRR